MVIKSIKLKGFSLVEMAVVLVIVGLLVGAGFSTLGPYLDNAKQSHTLGSLKTTKQAMLNYVKVNKYMPCPDSDGDGAENRTGTLGTECTVYLGTVPYDDLGLGRDVASDDYGNLFGYATHKQSNDSVVMGLDVLSTNVATATAAELALLSLPGSYFYNRRAPVFDLKTPPTAITIANNLDDPSESYRVCKKDSPVSCATSAVSLTSPNIEVDFIPAVVIAYNENGGVTSLTDCSGSRGAREDGNCDTDTELNPTFIKGYFKEGVYDDQMVVISAYEIKEHALGDFNDPPAASAEDPASPYAGYEVIYLKNVTSANDINISTDDDNHFYIGAKLDADGNVVEDGDLSANAVFRGGDDTLYTEGSITSSGDLKMGDGKDTLTVEKNIEGSVDTGAGDDVVTVTGVVSGSVKAGDDNDVLTFNGDISGSVDSELGFDQLFIAGDVLSGGSVVTGPSSGNKPDNDILTFTGTNIAGSIDLGRGADEIAFSSAVNVTGVVDGGSESNTLRLVGITEQAFKDSSGDADFSDNIGSIRSFGVLTIE